MNKIKQILYEDATNSKTMTRVGLFFMRLAVIATIFGVIFWKQLNIY